MPPKARPERSVAASDAETRIVESVIDSLCHNQSSIVIGRERRSPSLPCSSRLGSGAARTE